jgi:hypothetical protein
MNETKIVAAVVFVLFIGAVCFAGLGQAQDVTYCKNAQTGEVIVIEAGHACPFGYYRI